MLPAAVSDVVLDATPYPIPLKAGQQRKTTGESTGRAHAFCPARFIEDGQNNHPAEAREWK
jgi:hypothetical protein